MITSSSIDEDVGQEGREVMTVGRETISGWEREVKVGFQLLEKMGWKWNPRDKKCDFSKFNPRKKLLIF